MILKTITAFFKRIKQLFFVQKYSDWLWDDIYDSEENVDIDEQGYEWPWDDDDSGDADHGQATLFEEAG